MIKNSNIYQGQMQGPFEVGVDLFPLIAEEARLEDFEYVQHLGIQTDIPSIVLINGEEREIGKTGIYEIGNTKITSIIFTQENDNNTIIDYIIG